MRRLLLALPLLLAAPAAQAQITCLNCTEEIPEGINRVLVAANWVSQLRQMETQYNQMVTTYRSISNARNVSNVSQALYGLRDTASTANRLQQLAFGNGTSQGAGGFTAMNRYRPPTGNDFEAQEINRRQQAVANMQAEAQRGMQAAEQRRDSLDEFIGRINGTADLKEASGIQARLQQEQVELQNQHTKLEQMALLSQTQDRVDMLRGQEAGRAAATDWEATTESAWSGW